MTNVDDQSAWWNPLLTSAIFTWLCGTATLRREIICGTNFRDFHEF